MEIQSEVSYEKNQSLIGSRHKAIVDDLENGKLVARLASQAPEVDGLTTLDTEDETLIGSIVDIEITGCDIYDLEGRVV